MTATLSGSHGTVYLHRWSAAVPTFGVVLAHGYGEHAGRYAHVAARLVAEGATVIAPDHFGHGRSAGARAYATSLEPMVDDLQAAAALLRSEHPELPLVLIGHSMGGILATRLAQRDPRAWTALVLSGPAIGGNPGIAAMMAMDPLPEVPIDPTILSRDPAVGAAYLADPLVYQGPFQRAMLTAMFTAVDAIAAGPSFGALPTLWLHGENDALVPLATTRRAIAHVRGELLEEHIYPGAQHEVMNETNRKEVLDDIVVFLKRQLGASGTLYPQ